MDESKREVLIKDIKEYVAVLKDVSSLEGLPELTLVELHKALGTAVALILHMQQGED